MLKKSILDKIAQNPNIGARTPFTINLEPHCFIGYYLDYDGFEPYQYNTYSAFEARSGLTMNDVLNVIIENDAWQEQKTRGKHMRDYILESFPEHVDMDK